MENSSKEEVKPSRSRYKTKGHSLRTELRLSRKPLKRRGTALKNYWSSKRSMQLVEEKDAQTNNNNNNNDRSTVSDIMEDARMQDCFEEQTQPKNCQPCCSTDSVAQDQSCEFNMEDESFTRAFNQGGDQNTASDEALPFVDGRRIVDMGFFINQIKDMDDHPPFHCSFKDMDIVKELRHGLKSCFTMKCKMCGLEKKLFTDNTSKLVMDVNTSAVSGAISTGGGHSQLEEIVTTMNIPCMNYRTFRKYHNKIGDGWKETAQKEMLAAAEEEKQEAIRRGEIDKDGIPLLTVVADGCWAKRSYRTNYNSLSGVAAIVGYYSKKVLYIGVKNKYCTLCNRSEKTGEQVKDHTCYKNWGSNQSSSSMEAAIISEGFLCSEEMYGVRYARLIADGDSSVYQTILDKRPYKNLTVEKIECRNHLLRNYCNKIKEIVNTSGNRRFPINLRKVIGDNLVRLRYAVTKAIEYRRTENRVDKVVCLKEDILNGPLHVFGDHTKCIERGYFCDGTDKRKNKNIVPDLKEFGLFQKIEEAVRYLGLNSSSLIQNVDSNYAEQYNNIVAKFVGGKRINFTKSRSYELRCEGAVVQHNSGMAHYKLHKIMLGSSPGLYCKSNVLKRKAAVDKDRERRKDNPKIRCALFSSKTVPADKDYGPNAQRPDLPAEEFEAEKKMFLAKLSLNVDQRRDLQKRTIHQSNSAEWFEERRKRVCASTFGKICKRRQHTSCESLVRNLLYRSATCTEAMSYGRFHEEIALREVEEKIEKKIIKSGLVVDEILPHVAATPDGIFEDGTGIIEIKCPHKIRDEHPREAVKARALDFLTIDEDGIISLKKKHDYFYQVQGQLRVTNQSVCLLCVWSPKGMEMIEVKRDNEFWQKEMEPHLTKFYFDCILPELIDPRHPRSMSIRNPTWINEAQEKNKQKRQKK